LHPLLRRICPPRFEWTPIEGEQHVIHLGERPDRVEVPDYAHVLPEENIVAVT
jgi:hypothetical protein